MFGLTAAADPPGGGVATGFLALIDALARDSTPAGVARMFGLTAAADPPGGVATGFLALIDALARDSTPAGLPGLPGCSDWRRRGCAG